MRLAVRPPSPPPALPPACARCCSPGAGCSMPADQQHQCQGRGGEGEQRTQRAAAPLSCPRGPATERAALGRFRHQLQVKQQALERRGVPGSVAETCRLFSRLEGMSLLLLTVRATCCERPTNPHQGGLLRSQPAAATHVSDACTPAWLRHIYKLRGCMQTLYTTHCNTHACASAVHAKGEGLAAPAPALPFGSFNCCPSTAAVQLLRPSTAHCALLLSRTAQRAPAGSAAVVPAPDRCCASRWCSSSPVSLAPAGALTQQRGAVAQQLLFPPATTVRLSSSLLLLDQLATWPPAATRLPCAQQGGPLSQTKQRTFCPALDRRPLAADVSTRHPLGHGCREIRPPGGEKR